MDDGRLEALLRRIRFVTPQSEWHDTIRYWPFDYTRTEDMIDSALMDDWYARMVIPAVREMCDYPTLWGMQPSSYIPKMAYMIAFMTYGWLYDGLKQRRAERTWNPMIMITREWKGTQELMTADQALRLVDECDRCMDSMPDRDGLMRACTHGPLLLDRDTIHVLSRGWTGGEGGADADRFMARLHDEDDPLGMARIMSGCTRPVMDSYTEHLLIADPHWGTDRGTVPAIHRTLLGMLRSIYDFGSESDIIFWLLTNCDGGPQYGTGVFAAMVRTLACIDDAGFGTRAGSDADVPVITLSVLEKLVAACSGLGQFDGLPQSFVFETMLAEAVMVPHDTAMSMAYKHRIPIQWNTDGTFLRQGYEDTDGPMWFCGLVVINDTDDVEDGPGVPTRVGA